jgi:hypothetical protein
MEVQSYVRTKGRLGALMATLNDERTIITDEAKHEAVLQQVREVKILQDGPRAIYRPRLRGL